MCINKDKIKLTIKLGPLKSWYDNLQKKISKLIVITLEENKNIRIIDLNEVKRNNCGQIED